MKNKKVDKFLLCELSRELELFKSSQDDVVDFHWIWSCEGRPRETREGLLTRSELREGRTYVPVSSSYIRIPRDQKSTDLSWPLLRMISGATYSENIFKIMIELKIFCMIIDYRASRRMSRSYSPAPVSWKIRNPQV